MDIQCAFLDGEITESEMRYKLQELDRELA